MDELKDWLKFFEYQGDLFREMYLKPRWEERYSNHPNNIWDSLSIFLEGYAFERQGRKPDYGSAAVDALMIYKKRNNGKILKNAEKEIWNSFSQLLGHKSLNKNNNPLYPKIGAKASRSIIEIIMDSRIIENKLTYSTYLKDIIIKDNKTLDAHSFLKSTRGVGPKIASLYLRDLTDSMNINIENIADRYLLQPVDIWVERTIKIISKNQSMNKEQVAKWIVNNSQLNGINAERVNMGVWFFCFTMVHSKYMLEKVLKSLNISNQLTEDYKQRIKNIYRIC